MTRPPIPGGPRSSRHTLLLPFIPRGVEGRSCTFVALVLLAGCVTARTPVPVKPLPTPEVFAPPVDSQGALREVVASFVTATEARRFEQVRALLARPLRDRYSARTLERDFGADPQASERVAQIKKATASVVETKDVAALEWSEGRLLRLVREPEGWRISALE